MEDHVVHVPHAQLERFIDRDGGSVSHCLSSIACLHGTVTRWVRLVAEIFPDAALVLEVHPAIASAYVALHVWVE